MTIQQILRSMHGVWHGTYTIMKPDGTLIERYASQQEGRMEGKDWTEKVIYRRPGRDEEVRHFHAIVDGDATRFIDDELWGETERAGARAESAQVKVGSDDKLVLDLAVVGVLAHADCSSRLVQSAVRWKPGVVARGSPCPHAGRYSAACTSGWRWSHFA